MKKIVDIKQLEEVAKQISKKIKVGDVFLLQGDLGSGKTTFVKFLFKALGVSEEVNSPTFVIMKQYQGVLPLFHIDGYRLTTKEDLGFYELLQVGAVFIEWPSKLEPFWNKAQTIKFSYLNETQRLLEGVL